MSGDIKLSLAGKIFRLSLTLLSEDGDSTVSLTRSPATRAYALPQTNTFPCFVHLKRCLFVLQRRHIGQPPLTPSTSDDEHIPTSLSVTAPNSKRLSVLFAKSMPDLRPPSPKIASVEELSEEDGEEAEWLTQEMQDFVTLSPPSASDENLSSRPESFLPPLRMSNSFKDLSSPVIGPSAQLDPTFHFCQQKTRSFVIPSRPPPPPPIQICPASPLNNVFAVSSPCLSTTTIPPTPISSRPPPRSSIPCDVDELMQMDADDFDLLEDDLAEAHDSYPDSPFSSIFNAYQQSRLALPSDSAWMTCQPPLPAPRSPTTRITTTSLDPHYAAAAQQSQLHLLPPGGYVPSGLLPLSDLCITTNPSPLPGCPSFHSRRVPTRRRPCLLLLLSLRLPSPQRRRSVESSLELISSFVIVTNRMSLRSEGGIAGALGTARRAPRAALLLD
jgi:hypothetical protein